jgi:ATPase subunit of ABC transporter with duplicated ATPase domains
MRASLSLHDLHFSWPDGTVVLNGLDLAVGPGRHGLIGLNGTGKSTLLRLIAGDLTPQQGSVTVDGEVACLPQDPGVDPLVTVADVLGLAATLEALTRIEAGSTTPEDFDAVGDRWDIAERTQAELAQLGLGHLTLDRPIGSVSGGELVLLSLAARLLARPSVLLLDEPTNSLDAEARWRLIEVIAAWKGTLIVVSHDRDLLNAMDDIGSLRDGAVRWYGGGFDDYEAAVTVEQEAAARAVRSAEGDQRAQKRDLIDVQAVLAKRQRYAQKMREQKREPKIVMGARKRAAQVSAGKLRGTHEGRLEEAKARLTEAEALVHDDREIRVDLPETEVPGGRTVLRLAELRPAYGNLTIDLEIRGPERIGILGPNGSGKTSLLRTIAGELAPASGTMQVAVPWRYLPQRMDLLDPTLTVVENVREFAPTANENERRARLARFLFRGRDADQIVSTLSGGERLRATLACLLLADPSPQLLLLDEPTNNLDLPSIQHLVEALRSYRGALLVVSHDGRFLDDLDLTRRIEV